MADNGCKVKMALEVLKSFFENEEYCGICRRNFDRTIKILGEIREGNGSHGDLDVMAGAASQIINLCQCGRGKPVAEKFAEDLQKNRDDFTLHIENKICLAAECPKLVLAPCQAACPAGIDIPNYVALVGMGKYQEALDLIREDVPLPGTLGRICEHPCTKSCRRGQVDASISICALKRLAYDKSNENGIKLPEAPVRQYGEKIAVAGSGPAGLSAAYFLAKRGYGVTIFEAMPEPGGMLAYGIPPYRLPRQVLRDEIDYIKALGVEIRLNSPISGAQGLNALLQEGYAAVFLGTGAWKGSVPVPNAGLKGILDGVTFLRAVNHELSIQVNQMINHVPGKSVVVVGGGNVAIDAARTSLRLGAREVRIIYRRTREEMPALNEEIVDAEHEGIVFDYLVSPVGVGGENGRVTYIQCQRNALSDPDASGRRKPVPVKNSEYRIAADMIIFATGQQPDLSFLEDEGQITGVETFKNLIVTNRDTMETSRPGIFAGGDAVTGPASAIMAIAAGKRAAAAIHAHLRGEKPSAAIKYPVKRKSISPMQINAEEKTRFSIIDYHELYRAERKDSFAEIMEKISEAAAYTEAARCLRCDICTACGTCADVCRTKVGPGAIQLGYVQGECDTAGTDFSRPTNRCIGCGTCSLKCPTGAITMEDRDGIREVRMCGGLMSRLDLVYCQECGLPFATSKHVDYVNDNMSKHSSPLYRDKSICPDCSPKGWTRKVFSL